MLLTMLSARLPCSAILSRLPVSISIVSSISARVSSSSVAMPGAALSFSSSSSSIDSPAKLLTKLSGFLISWAMPGGQLAERRHLLRLDQIGLRRLADRDSAASAASRAARISASRRLRSVMSRVDQHEAAVRHRVAADLDYLPIRAGSFEAQFLVSVLETAAEFRLDVDGYRIRPARQDTEIFSIARTLGQKSFGKVSNLLEIAVPRGQPQVVRRTSRRHRPCCRR